MFHKDLTRRIERLEDRVNKFESRMEDLKDELRRTTYYEFGLGHSWPLQHKLCASQAIEKILEHLKLEFECEEAKEAECHLISTFPPKKPKKKAKKMAKEKK